MKIFLVFILVIAIMGIDFSAAQEARHVIRQPVRIDFTQEKIVSLLDEKIESKGLIVSDGTRIRWEITEPYKSVCIFDGSEAVQYEYENGKWRLLRSNPRLAEIFKRILAVLSGDLNELEGGAFRVLNSGIDSIVLKPASEAAAKFVSEIRIRKDKSGDPTELKIVDAGGDVSLLKFTNIVKNPTGIQSAFDKREFNKETH